MTQASFIADAGGEHGSSLLLAVLQWISLVFGTEKEMLIGEAFCSSAEKDF